MVFCCLNLEGIRIPGSKWFQIFYEQIYLSNFFMVYVMNKKKLNELDAVAVPAVRLYVEFRFRLLCYWYFDFHRKCFKVRKLVFSSKYIRLIRESEARQMQGNCVAYTTKLIQQGTNFSKRRFSKFSISENTRRLAVLFGWLTAYNIERQNKFLLFCIRSVWKENNLWPNFHIIFNHRHF